jgi:hypothetical protein
MRRIVLTLIGLTLVVAGCGGAPAVVPDRGGDSGSGWRAILHPETTGYDDEKD